VIHHVASNDKYSSAFIAEVLRNYVCNIMQLVQISDKCNTIYKMDSLLCIPVT